MPSLLQHCAASAGAGAGKTSSAASSFSSVEIGIISNTQSIPNFIEYLGEKVKTDENQKSELYKIDYVLPIGEDGQFEMGYRRSNTYINTDYLVEDENSNGEFIKNTNLSNNLFYNEKVNAYYSQYGNKKNSRRFNR